MVRRIFGILTREIRGMHEAAYVLAGFSVLSQVLGLLRDRTFAHLFGAGPTLDAYFAAFRIPDLLFAFLTLFVSTFALIPLLSVREGEERGALLACFAPWQRSDCLEYRPICPSIIARQHLDRGSGCHIILKQRAC